MVSVSLDFESGLAGGSWLGVSHEVAVEMVVKVVARSAVL